MLCLQAVIARSPKFGSTCFFFVCVQFIESAHLELNLAQGVFPNSVTKVSPRKQRSLWGSVVSQGLSVSQLLLFLRTKRKPSMEIFLLQAADSLALLVRGSGNVLSVSAGKKINWHSCGHSVSCARAFVALTIFYLLVNVPNYSVKHRQRFAVWRAHWNGNATISKWKFFHLPASKWIYSWQFTPHAQDYTNERVKGCRVCVCMWPFLCFHTGGLLPCMKRSILMQAVCDGVCVCVCA